MAVIYNRIYYYVNGEFAYATAGAGGKAASYVADRLTDISSSGLSPLAASTARVVGESAQATLREL